MKRCRFGLFLMLLLLVLGLFSSRTMEQIHREEAQLLEEAGKYALAGNWHQAAAHTAKARMSWARWSLLRSALADHSPMEEIETNFHILEVYGSQKEQLAFAALCQDMSRQLEALGEAQVLHLRNLL